MADDKMKKSAPRGGRLGGMLGLCKRAGRLRSGTDQVCDGVRSGEVILVLLASDCSANTRKRTENCCGYYGVECLGCGMDMDSLAKCVGRVGSVGSVGIADAGFASAITKILTAESEENGTAKTEPLSGAENKQG